MADGFSPGAGRMTSGRCIAWLAATCAGALLLAACSRDPAPLPQAAPAPASTAASAPSPAANPQRVLIAAPQAQGVEWRLVDAGSGGSRSLGAAASDVELWALDDSRGDFYFASATAIWRGNWRQQSQPVQPPQRLASQPALEGALYAAWVDAGSGGLQAIEMREPKPAEAKRMKADPPDARPYWALLWTLGKDGWTVLEKRSTSWGADGSVGPAVFDDKRKEQGRSARTLDDAASCVKLCDDSVPAPAGVDPGEAQEWRTLPGTGLLFGVALGDAWHPLGPVLASAADGRTRVLHSGGAEPLRLQWRHNRLLLSAATLPTEASVVDGQSDQRRALGTSATPPAWVD